MKAMKKPLAALCALALGLGLLAGCGEAAGGTDAAAGSAASATGSYDSDKVKDEDLDAGWDSSATTIALEGMGATVNGGGASAEGSAVTITEAGTYVISGTLADGQLLVDAPGDALVRLVLNGADITCSSSAPIFCDAADKLLIILADGTQNTLTDSGSYTFPDAATDEPNAALFCRADLTINGGGTLTVNASYNNGIGTKDDLILVSGSIEVDAANHAIRGRDSVTVLEAALTLTAGNDGIQSNNTDADKGWIELYGGTYTITSAHDGIQAESALTISGGEYTITAGGGAENAEERAEESFSPGGGMGGRGNWQMPGDGTMPEMPADGTFPEMPPDGAMPERPADRQPPDDTAQGQGLAATLSDDTSADTTTVDADTAATDESAEDSDNATTSTSYKGIKAGTELTITGGTFAMNCADDTVHSNLNVTISGGGLTLATGDDGIHADDTVLIEDGAVIDITESYEGIEGATVLITGGTISAIASDDAINAAGGRDESTDADGFGGDMFASSGDYVIRIEGGDITLTAGTDGLDSNGGIEMTGGTITLNMSAAGMGGMGGDGLIDRDGALSITGGTIMGAGANGIVTMGPSNSTDSTQAIAEIYYTAPQAAGSLVELKDENGDTLAGFTPDHDFSCVVLTAPGMAGGETYTLYTGGSETLTFTLTGAVTSLSDTGAAHTGQQGRMGGMGAA